MPRTKDITLLPRFGEFFWHRVRLAEAAPRVHLFSTVEYEEPYRTCSRTIVLRLRNGLGIAIGRWKHTGFWYDIEEEIPNLISSLEGREDGDDIPEAMSRYNPETGLWKMPTEAELMDFYAELREDDPEDTGGLTCDCLC